MISTTQPSQPDALLLAEGAFIHGKLFGFTAPPEILSRYATFSRTIGASAKWPQIERVILADIDVEAVEYAFRFRRRHHPLQQRIHGLCFICEAHPRYWNLFYSDQSARGVSWVRLSLALARTGWLWIKGSYLIYRHHLV
jgi:hypothetical protein